MCMRVAALIFGFWAWLAPTATVAGERVALVVGNGGYQNVTQLANPANDARGIAETLKGLGFDLVGGGAQVDLDKASLERAVRNFGEALKSGGVGLFYYAGHGLQVRGVNYLVPVNANPTGEADIDFELVDANLVLRQMESAKTRLNILILDACRNNPFGGRGFRAVTTGLAQMQAPEGTIISFATQPGNVARDGADGHSPFAKAIMATIVKPRVNVLEAFNDIGLSVKRDTGGSQQPWIDISPIDGEFFFAGAPAAAPPAVAAPPPAPTPVAAQSDAELLFWQSIANSTNPADYEAYLQTYPNGRFVALAKVRAFARTEAPKPAPATATAAALPPVPAVQPVAQPAPEPPKPASAAPPTTKLSDYFAQQVGGEAANTAPPRTKPSPKVAYVAPPPAPPRPEPNYAQELTNFGVAPTNVLAAIPHGYTPMTIPGGHVISTQALVQMGQQRNDIIAIDALSGPAHPTLPKAVWIPAAGQGGSYADAVQAGLGRVLGNLTGGNLNRTLVFFCQSSECWMSYNAALRAIHLGYRNVYWYRGGLAAWQQAGLPTGAPAATF